MSFPSYICIHVIFKLFVEALYVSNRDGGKTRLKPAFTLCIPIGILFFERCNDDDNTY